MDKLSWRKLCMSFAAGALLVFAFAPFKLFLLAFLSLAVLFYFWLKGSAKTNFYLGLSYGLGLYCFGVSWVYVSLSTYGGMPLWMGSIAVLGFASLLALFIALTGYVAARFFKRYIILCLPFIWLIFEWSKSWVLTGFPWLDVGYTQTPSWLFNWAPLGGVYMVSFIVLSISACLANFANKVISNDDIDRKRLYVFTSGAIAVVVLSSFVLGFVQWSKPIGKALQIGIVQPNTSIEDKWKASYQSELISKLASLSAQLQKKKHNDLIIWPETALPLYVQQTDDAFWHSVTPKGTEILTGIMDSPNPNDHNEIYNAALLTCQGSAPKVYRKTHLVPFGEYLPLRFLFNWVLEYLQLPMSDLSSWQGVQSLDCGDSIKIGLSVCYEDAFGDEYRRSVGDATILVNISEDAWFGDSFAPHQRQQMAQMRAAELARPLIRSANSGPSLVIDVKGKVIEKTNQFEITADSFPVQPYTGDTLYKRLGNWVIYLSFLVLMILLITIRKQKNS